MHVDVPHLRLVWPPVTDPRMYRDPSKPRRPTDREMRVAAEAAAELRRAIIERGWSMPPPVFEAVVSSTGYVGYHWPVIYLRASDGSGEWIERGFGFRTKRPGDVIDAEPFRDIFEEHGFEWPSSTTQ